MYFTSLYLSPVVMTELFGALLSPNNIYCSYVKSIFWSDACIVVTCNFSITLYNICQQHIFWAFVDIFL